MKKRDSDLLTPTEWGILERVVLMNLSFFVTGQHQHHMMNFFIRVTISFRKFEERTRLGYFLRPFFKAEFLGGGIDRVHAWRLRKDLIDRDLIGYQETKFVSGKFSVQGGVVRVNSYGIVEKILQSLIILGGMGVEDSLKTLIDLRDTLKKIWKEKGWKLIVPEFTEVGMSMSSIEDGMNEGKKVSETARAKRAAKMLEESFNPSHIPAYLKAACDRKGLKYRDEWTGKLTRCGKNFQTYCKEMGEDPKKVLEDVVENWDSLIGGVVSYASSGRPIQFNRWVSFEEFFKHRREVMGWLLTKKPARERVAKRIDLKTSNEPEPVKPSGVWETDRKVWVKKRVILENQERNS